jgi:hypothetical protein
MLFLAPAHGDKGGPIRWRVANCLPAWLLGVVAFALLLTAGGEALHVSPHEGGGPIFLAIAAVVVLLLTLLASERVLMADTALAGVAVVVSTLNFPPSPLVVTGLVAATVFAVASGALLFVVRLRRLRVLLALRVPSDVDAHPAGHIGRT